MYVYGVWAIRDMKERNDFRPRSLKDKQFIWVEDFELRKEKKRKKRTNYDANEKNVFGKFVTRVNVG